MAVEIKIIADDTYGLVLELRQLLETLDPGEKAPAPVQTPEEEKEEPKAEPAAEPKPKPKPKKKAAAKKETDPVADWQEALTLMTKIYGESPEGKAAVKGALKELGVSQFKEIPKEKGTELLEIVKGLETK